MTTELLSEPTTSPAESRVATRFAEFLRASVTYQVEAGFRGYNLVRHGGRFCGLSLRLGAVDLSRTCVATLREFQEQRLCFVAASIAELKQQIAEHGYRLSPELLEQGFHGFNLVAFQDRVFALATKLGAVNLPGADEATLSAWQAAHTCFVAESVAGLKAQIEEFVAPAAPSDVASNEPVGDEYREHRLVEHSGVWHAVPRNLGRLNLDSPALRHLPQILSTKNRGDLCSAIDRALAVRPPAAAPQLVTANHRGHAIYSYCGLHLACEAARGELDLGRWRAGQFGRCFAHETLVGVKQAIDEAVGAVPVVRTGRTLLVCDASPARVNEIIAQHGLADVTLLVTDRAQRWPALPTLVYQPDAPGFIDSLRAGNFELVVVPYGPKLGNVAWERLASFFCRQLLAIFSDGTTRLYRNDHFSRILYNMAYLRSMYAQVPAVAGQRVLEVGCSDGLPSDLVAHEAPASVVGVDMLDNMGLLYAHPRVAFQKLDATTLPFADRSFDLAYSIATFEHVDEPLAAFNEMKRVLRPGGYGYVQTAPFYYSPFGHHMFGYFDHSPWIHVRRSKAEIVEYAHQSGLAAKIESARGGTAENYIEAMINLHHVNGKLLHEYGVEAFGAQAGVEIVRFQPSYEGEHLLTPEILAECRPVRREDLITHGFELVFRVK